MIGSALREISYNNLKSEDGGLRMRKDRSYFYLHHLFSFSYNDDDERFTDQDVLKHVVVGLPSQLASRMARIEIVDNIPGEKLGPNRRWPLSLIIRGPNDLVVVCS